jgi:hypothetical protein
VKLRGEEAEIGNNYDNLWKVEEKNKEKLF